MNAEISARKRYEMGLLVITEVDNDTNCIDPVKIEYHYFSGKIKAYNEYIEKQRKMIMSAIISNGAKYCRIDNRFRGNTMFFLSTNSITGEIKRGKITVLKISIRQFQNKKLSSGDVLRLVTSNIISKDLYSEKRIIDKDINYALFTIDDIMDSYVQNQMYELKTYINEMPLNSNPVATKSVTDKYKKRYILITQNMWHITAAIDIIPIKYN